MFAHDGEPHAAEEVAVAATNTSLIDIFVFASVLFFVITIASLLAYKGKKPTGTK